MRLYCCKLALLLAASWFMVGGCNFARRQPVASIDPTYSYLRTPIDNATVTPAATVASVPVLRDTPPTIAAVRVE